MPSSSGATCSNSVSAPAGLTRTYLNGASAGAPSKSSATRAQDITTPLGPTSRRSDTSEPHDSQYDVGGTATWPHDSQTPASIFPWSRSAARNVPTTSPVVQL